MCSACEPVMTAVASSQCSAIRGVGSYSLSVRSLFRCLFYPHKRFCRINTKGTHSAPPQYCLFACCLSVGGSATSLRPSWLPSSRVPSWLLLSSICLFPFSMVASTCKLYAVEECIDSCRNSVKRKRNKSGKRSTIFRNESQTDFRTHRKWRALRMRAPNRRQDRPCMRNHSRAKATAQEREQVKSRRRQR